MNKKPKTTDITIRFDNPKVAEHFADWLCNIGEQDYWQSMEYREREEDGDITAVSFNYWGKTGRGKFMCDNIIRTEAGRLDADRDPTEDNE